MAAKNTNVSLPMGDWTEITDSDVSAATVDNVGLAEVIIMATVGAVAPIEGDNDGIRLASKMGIKSSDTLADLYPGVSGATRIYALCRSGDGEVFISHA